MVKITPGYVTSLYSIGIYRLEEVDVIKSLTKGNLYEAKQLVQSRITITRM